jgi:hypothetical protein
MKHKLLAFLFIATATLLFFNSCKKNSDNPTSTPTHSEILNAGSSKTWQIEKIYINDTLLALTPEQLNYTKTYKSDSAFFDSDGISGKYRLINEGKKLEESLILGGTGTSYYDVEVLTASQLVLKLTSDGANTFNNKFYFRAK